jgi:hypothetical protein
LLKSIEKEYDYESSEVMVFDPDLIKSTCHLKKIENEPQKNSSYYITFKTAFGVDYLVAMVFESKKDHYYQTEMYRMKEIKLIDHIHRISELIKKYKPTKVGIETMELMGMIFFKILRKANPDIKFVEIRTTLSLRAIMIEKLNGLFEQKKISLFDDSKIKKEFLFIKKEVDGSFGSVKDHSDDIVMATAFLTMIIEDFTYYKYAD